MKKVYIETLGCQMNKSDTEKMLGMLDFLGYEEVCELKDKNSADLLIINTCSIRQLSEDKAFSRIGTWGKWKKSRPELRIAFCGCVAQKTGAAVFKRMPFVDLVMGTHNINELPELIKRIEAGEKICATGEIPMEEKDIKLKRAKGVNAWITITEGCDNFCTYCIVPYTRGRERSRAPEIIMKEAKEALAQGFKEITLLGQNVDSYGKGLTDAKCKGQSAKGEEVNGKWKMENGKLSLQVVNQDNLCSCDTSNNYPSLAEGSKSLISGEGKDDAAIQKESSHFSPLTSHSNINLAYLLRELNAIEGKFRIRFTTSYPTDITDELIDTVIACDKVCECLHIPMQSGSSEILKKMNRRYDRETYFKIVKKIREKMPDVTITSDFIAGFPGESEKHFEQTLTAMQELELDYSNTAAYSPREQTIAAKWEEFFLSDEVKEDRLKRLNDQNKANCLASNNKYIGRELEVLIDNFENHKGKNILTGRTRNNKIVHIPHDKNLVGEFVTVKITGAKTWYLKGELK